MKRLLPVFLVLLLVPVHLFSLRIAAEKWKTLPKGDEAGFAIPSPVLKLTSLEFDGLISDIIFLRDLIFIGSTFERVDYPKVKEWEWRRLYASLSAATDLDPYFFDPYYVAQAHLTWSGSMVRETNLLLEKGSRHREWDWLPPFYMGFNSFYFLQENEEASAHLLEASLRSGFPTLASLATRLAIKGKQTENAIVFLKELLKREEDETIKKGYETRLQALQAILLLEREVARYKSEFGHPPVSLEELVVRGLLEHLPPDPYGGEFYLGTEGAIQSTSGLSMPK